MALETNSWASFAFMLGLVLAWLGVLLFIASRVVGDIRQVKRHRSLAGALYDARVAHTYGALQVAPRGMTERSVKVVGLELEHPGVGLEVQERGRLGFRLHAVRLTPDEAVRLAAVLEAEASR